MTDRLLVCGIGSGMERSLAELRELDVELVVVHHQISERTATEAEIAIPADPGNHLSVLEGLTASGVDKVNGVLSLGYENPPTISRLAEALDCWGLPQQVALDCTHKNRRIAILRDAGLSTPRFAVAHTPAQAMAAVEQLSLPAVVKPADQTSSVGVAYLDSAASAPALIAQAFELSAIGIVVIEEYLIGTEHTIAGLAVDGTAYITGFADREYGRKHEFAPCFFEEGDTLPSQLPSAAIDAAIATARRGLSALGLHQGPFNLDVLITADGRIVLLEVAARMTGARIATEIMPLATGARLLPNAARQALGRSLVLEELQPRFDRVVVQRYRPATGGTVEWLGELSDQPSDERIYDLFWAMPLRAGTVIPQFRTGVDNVAGVIVAGGSLDEANQVAADALATLPLKIR